MRTFRRKKYYVLLVLFKNLNAAYSVPVFVRHFAAAGCFNPACLLQLKSRNHVSMGVF